MKKITTAILLTILILVQQTSTAVAFNPTYQGTNNIPWVDDREVPCRPNVDGALGSNTCSCTVAPPLVGEISGTENLERILRFYTSKGLSLSAASGIAGNYKQESVWNPRAIQGDPPRFADDTYKPVHGVGFGLAQWTWSDRQQPLVNFAKSQSKPITDLGVQLEYSWLEMTDINAGAKKALKELLTEKSKSDPGWAAYVFHQHYEVSKDTEAAVRKNRGLAAEAIYKKYKDTINDGDSTLVNQYLIPTVNNEPLERCSENGGSNGTISAGFNIYNQFDAKYADISIRRDTGAYTTISRSGCGVMSMAMIIHQLNGTPVNINDMARIATKYGLITKGGGYHTMSIRYAKEYGLRSDKTRLNSNDISTALREGKLVQIVGKGPRPFTRGGHFVMLRGITADGNWLVGNSNGRKGIEDSNNEEGFKPSYIIAYARTAYVISK